MKDKLLSLYQDLNLFEKKQNKVFGINLLYAMQILTEMGLIILPLSFLMLPLIINQKISTHPTVLIAIISALVIYFVFSTAWIIPKLKAKITSVNNQIITNLSNYLKQTQYDDILKHVALIEIIYTMDLIYINHMDLEKAQLMLDLIESADKRKQWVIKKMADKFFFAGLEVIQKDIIFAENLLNKKEKELKEMAKLKVKSYISRINEVNKEEQGKIQSILTHTILA